MKKRIYALVVVFALIFTSLTFSHSERTDSNGSTLAELYAVQRDGRTIVSIRPICDVLGATLDWAKDTQTVRGQRSNDVFELTMGRDSKG